MAFFKKLFKSDKDKKGSGSPSSPQSPSSDTPQGPAKMSRDDFTDIEVLGKGTFAKVLLVKKNDTAEYFAMKVIDKKTVIDHKRQNDAFIERNVMRRLPHPYLLRLHGTFQTEHKLFFVIDYMPGGDMDKYLNGLPSKAVDLETARLYSAQLFLAIRFLHENGVIYRDLKPENVLMSREGHAVLADFGLSKDFGQQQQAPMEAASFVGSPFYVAPDVLRQKGYTQAIDYWSLGILIYRMAYGRPPFSGRTMKDVFDAIAKQPLEFPDGVAGDEKIRDLITKLLAKDPAQRADAKVVADHQFWSGLNFDAVMAGSVIAKSWVALPTAEEHVAAIRGGGGGPVIAPAPGKPAAPTANQVMHTPAGAQQLSSTQQKNFNEFSSVA